MPKQYYTAKHQINDQLKQNYDKKKYVHFTERKC